MNILNESNITDPILLRERLAALETSEKRLRTTFFSIGEGVISVDSLGYIQQMNPAAEKLTGWNNQEALGRRVEEVFRIVDEQTRKPVENPLHLVLRQGRTMDRVNHTVLLARDGTQHVIASSSAPIRDLHGTISGGVLTFRDQTDERLIQRYIETRLNLIQYAAGHSIDELLTKCLDEVGAFVDSPIGFYHFVESDQKTLSLQQWSTATLKQFCQTEAHGVHYPIDQAGVWVDCVHQRKPVIHNDYASLAHKKGMPEGHALVTRELVVPVMRDDKVVAILGVGNKPTDYNHKDVEIVSYLADVTWEIVRQKKAEDALRQSEERYRLLFDNSDMLVSVFDTDGVCVLLNPKMAELLGGNPEDFERAPMASLYPDAAEVFVERIRLALASGVSREYEDKVAFPHGERFLLTRVSPVPDAQGVFRSAQFVSHDITDRKHAQEALRESEERFRLLVDSAPIAILVLEEGRVIFGNPEAARMLGYDQPGEMVGIDALEKVAPKYRHVVGRGIERTARGRRTVPFEIQLIKTDGELIWCSAASVLIRVTGVPTALVVAQEITDHKTMEAERAQLETQFHQVQKLESVGRLAGGIAHDLNNLLFPIIGYSEMLAANGTLATPSKEPLEEILKAGLRARDLVHQLLAFSRKQDLIFEILDLNVLLNDFKSLLRRTIREDIDIAITLAPSLPLIRGDATRLEQVIMNLAVNAQDAMPDGGRLTIETARTELGADYAAKHEGVAPGSYAMLMVNDTGCGMDADTRQHLFEPFFTTKSKEDGTGLGLATVYGIVKQHSGHIWYYSEPGLGSSFKVYLPESKQAATVKQTQRPVKITGDDPKKILLVEDNQQVRRLVFTMLEKIGHSVITAGNGKEALIKLQAHSGPLDIIMTDVIMPGMNGSELVERVLETYPDIKVLYMSGYTENIIAHHGIIDKETHLIVKPFNIDALAEKLRKVIGHNA